MKKILLTFFAGCLAIAAHAQIEKGTVLISGYSTLGFVAANEDAGGDNNFNLSVRSGYFFANNFTAGLSVYFDKHKETDATLAVGPFARYYINGKVFVGAGLNILSQGDVTGSQILMETGYAWFVNDVVAIEPMLNVGVYGGDITGASFGLNIALSVYLGRGK